MRNKDRLVCLKTPTVLKCMFCLFVSCLSVALTKSTASSVGDGCQMMLGRGTKNFGMDIVHSGNRRKFTSMFNCASLVHPCTSVACCQMKFPVPLTALIRHLYFDEPCSYSGKHWKDCFNHKKKNTHIRTVVFRSERKSTAN